MKEKFLELERELIPLTTDEQNQLKGGYDGQYNFTHEEWAKFGFNPGYNCSNTNCWEEVPSNVNENCLCWDTCGINHSDWPGGEDDCPYGTGLPTRPVW